MIYDISYSSRLQVERTTGVPEMRTNLNTGNFFTTCQQIVRVIRALKGESKFVADLCNNDAKMIETGRRHALNYLKDTKALKPTFILVTKAGEGLLIPIILENIPEEPDMQTVVANPLSATINLAPIDAYIFIGEVWDGAHKPLAGQLSESVFLGFHTRRASKYFTFTIARNQNNDVVDLTQPQYYPNLQPTNKCLRNLYKTPMEIADMLLGEGPRTVH